MSRSTNGNGIYAQTQTPTALLSCQSCRRRKVRCDKELPSCSLCMKSSQTCTYPPGPLKPGPKLGSSQRSLKRPRRSKEDESDQANDDNGTVAIQQESNALQHRRTSSNAWDPELLAGASTQWQPQPELRSERTGDSSHAITSTSEQSHQSPGSTCSTITSESSRSLNLPALSSIIHPSHESAPQTMLGEEDSKEVKTPVYGDEVCSKSAKRMMLTQICDALQITKEVVAHL